MFHWVSYALAALGGDLDGSLQELLTESMEELERQMASKEAETGGSRFWTRGIFGSGGILFGFFFGGRDHGAMIFTSLFARFCGYGGVFIGRLDTWT